MFKLFDAPKPVRPRQLEYRIGMAQKDHDCMYRRRIISTGEEYERYVYLTDGKIVVSKYHWPYCPQDPYEDEEELDRIERESQPQTQKPAAKKAA